jgi:uncharacterized membrane protein
MRAGLLCLLLACAGDEADGDKEIAGDTGLCATAPVTTWDNFGRGFLTESCQSCHASTSPNRYGAPEAVSFDSEGEALALADTILAVATGEAARMPPSGGVTEEDRYRLAVWLTCDAGPTEAEGD